MTHDDRLLAIDDERAIVYELDYLDGGLIKAFALGDPVLRDDFEGLAVADDYVYLMTSKGEIYRAREGQDGDRVGYEHFESNVDDECEFEGLAEDIAGNRLLLICKDLKKKAGIDRLAIYPWDLDEQKVDQSARLSLPLHDISMSLRLRRLHPSGIVVDDETGHLVIVAAREQALIELDSAGKFVNARRLPLNRRHPQAEGIELSRIGLLLSDEGGNSKARLSVYRPDDAPAAVE